MDFPPFEWHDGLRVVSTVICFASLFYLARVWRMESHTWTRKVRDYWFALFMWSFAGIVICIEGILRDVEFGIRSIFVIAASTITLKGLMTKGTPGEIRDT